MAEEVFATRQGLEMLEQERDQLVAERRKVAERLKEAISYGDLSENAEYDAAKNEQAELEDRIRKIEAKIRNTVVINEEEVTVDCVNLGLLVTVKDLDRDTELRFIIVSSNEADPFSDPARISNESAIGNALMGREKGEVLEIAVPDRMLRYEITDIQRSE